LAGFRFRRQVPIGPYVADFARRHKLLIIEVDGEQHGEDAEREWDLRRTGWLRSRGFRTLRFWNQEVLSQSDGVVEVILQALQDRYLDDGTPSPPSPQRGR
jgi:very-short-patch-repair endonuclease